MTSMTTQQLADLERIGRQNGFQLVTAGKTVGFMPTFKTVMAKDDPNYLIFKAASVKALADAVYQAFVAFDSVSRTSRRFFSCASLEAYRIFSDDFTNYKERAMKLALDLYKMVRES